MAARIAFLALECYNPFDMQSARRFLAFVLCLLAIGLVWAQRKHRRILLPSSKTLTSPAPGAPQKTNSFTATIALSPDHHYAALLNDGYGTQEALARQSISILNLTSNQLTDFPDDRFAEEAHQSLFLGLVFGSDGKHLYASVGSISDPLGEKAGNLGNGIAVYSFKDATVTPERFIPIPLQRLPRGAKASLGVRKASTGMAIPYPAGMTLIPHQSGDQLLVANNLSDNVVLVTVATGRVENAFDLSTSKKIVPSSFPLHHHRHPGRTPCLVQFMECVEDC